MGRVFNSNFSWWSKHGPKKGKKSEENGAEKETEEEKPTKKGKKSEENGAKKAEKNGAKKAEENGAKKPNKE